MIDAGFGVRSLKRRLTEADLELSALDAIFLTHGHTDHVAGVPSVLKEFPETPVYMSEGTRFEVPALTKVESWERLESAVKVEIGEFSVEPFDVPHDAAEPLGFRVTTNGTAGVLATDLGEITPIVDRYLERCDWMVLESNHDVDLLKVGPYPWELKRRVLSRTGHLSNNALADFLRHSFDGTAQHLFLAHLSRQNNEPELAFSAAHGAVCERHPLFGSLDLNVHLTHQIKPSIVLDL